MLEGTPVGARQQPETPMLVQETRRGTRAGTRTRSAPRSVRENRAAIALADHPLPVSATTAAELATARLDRDDLESVPG